MRVVSGARHGRLTTLKFLNDGRMACLGEETTLRGDGVGINPGFGQPPTRKSIIASVYRQKLALYRMPAYIPLPHAQEAPLAQVCPA